MSLYFEFIQFTRLSPLVETGHFPTALLSHTAAWGNLRPDSLLFHPAWGTLTWASQDALLISATVRVVLIIGFIVLCGGGWTTFALQTLPASSSFVVMGGSF